MNDNVKKLRLLAAVDNCQVSIDAADEIEALTARVAELEGALRQIAGIDPWDNAEQGYVDKARAALTQPIAAFLAAQEPLGAECERVWDANADKLYASAAPTQPAPEKEGSDDHYD